MNMMRMFFVLTVLAIIWSMMEMVSPHVVLRIYRKAGMNLFTERQAIRLIRIDGFVSWIIFTLIGSFLYGKL